MILARSAARVLLALALGGVGVMHFVSPRPFVQHLPPALPGREAVVYGSGVVEILLGVALMVAPARRRATVGRAVVAFLVAVFPANVYVAVSGVEVDGYPEGAFRWWRLPFQAVLIAWALWSTRTETVER